MNCLSLYMSNATLLELTLEHGNKYPLNPALLNSDFLRYFYSMWK